MNNEFVYQEADVDDGDAEGTTPRSTECPECGGDGLVTDDVHGEVVCGECGCVVMTEQVDTGPEWTAFDEVEREQKSRVGAPVTRTMHDRGLTTEIHWQDTDVNGQQLSPRKQARMQRLRTWQERIRTNDPGERNLRLALAEINRMASALEVPDPVREAAAVVYRQAMDEGLIQGRSIEGVATGTLYVACRQENIPRSLDELADVSRVSRVEIGRTYRYLASELGLELRPIDPQQFLPRFCSELDLGRDVQERASEILAAAAEEGLHSGRSPTGLAGAAIYYASLLVGEKRTQAEIAEVAQVTEVTIRNRYQEQASLREDGPA
jgi:transcription initiation factor TFIIB